MNGRAVGALGAFAYVAGTCALALLVAGVAFGHPLSSGWPLAGIALLSCFLGALAALAVVGRDRRLERVRNRPQRTLLFALPIACAIAVLVVGRSRTGTVLGPGLVFAVVSLAGYRALVLRAETHHTRRLLEGRDRLVSLSETAERTTSRRLRALTAAWGVLTLLVALGGLLEGEGPWYWYVILALTLFGIAAQSDRSVTVTDRGLLFESWYGAKLLEWSAFDGYYVGAELVVLRSGRWPRTLTVDGEEVDAAVEIVDRYLPRSASPAVPAGGLEREDVTVEPTTRSGE